MGDRLRVAFIALAAFLAGSFDCSPQTGSAFPDGAALSSERLSLCRENIPPERIIPLPHTVGCERWDCCPQCPGPPSWRVNVGPDAEALLLQFQNLSRDARKGLLVEGNAKWEKDGRLRLGPGETRISRLRPDQSGRWPVAFASVALSKEKLERGPAVAQGRLPALRSQAPRAGIFDPRPQQIAFGVRQFSGQTMVGAINVSIESRACRSGGGEGPTGSEGIAVANAAAASVTVYGLPINPNLGGGVSPNREIVGPHTQIGLPVAVAVDGAGQIYVLSQGDIGGPQAAAVTVYARGANGDAAPARTITSAVLIAGLATGLAVDEAGDVFTASASQDGSGDNVAVFAPGAQGFAVPVQVITDGIHAPQALAASRDGNFLYVVNGIGKTITVYHRAFGFYSLVQTIPPPSDPNDDVEWGSIAVDAAGLVYAVPTFVSGVPNSAVPLPTVFIFQRDANGTYALLRQFNGFVGDRQSIAVDTRGFVYVTEAFAGGGLDAVRVFGPHPSGLAQIVSTIAGLTSQLAFPEAIAIVP